MQNNRLQSLLTLLEKQPDDPFLIYALALEYETAGEETVAQQYYIKLLEENPAYLATYYQYGNLLARQNKFKEAAEILNKGIELAREQKNNKTLRELNEVLQWVEDEM